MPRPRFVLAAMAFALAPAAAPAQVAYPPQPEEFVAHIRYRAPAGRNERIIEHRAMAAFFESLGFVPAEREDADLDIFDPVAERTHGTIPARNAAKLLQDPRVLAVVLVPAGTDLPDDPKRPLQVRVALARGLEPISQKRLHDQSVAKLAELGFREAVGYDHGGYTRARGSLPAGQLFHLLRDLRFQPAGWFVPVTPFELLPLPLKSVYPIRLVEVLPELPNVSVQEAEAVIADPNAAKLTDDLRTVLAEPGAAEKALRVEVVFDAEPLGGLKDLEHTLRSTAAGARPEGLVGSVATVLLRRAADALKLAEAPEVKALRLPTIGHQTVLPAATDANGAVPVAQLISDSRLNELHALGYRGQGTKVALIAAGFPGVNDLIGSQLPAGTKVVDLTAELDPSLKPAAEPPHAGGTAAALALSAAAPAAELTLVRVDPTAFHQLLTVARAVAAEGANSVALQARATELRLRNDDLTTRRAAVVAEYQAAFADLSDEDEPTRRRAAAAKALEALRANERDLRETKDRYLALRNALDDLKNANLVVNTLVWEDGYPNDGLSEVSQYLGTRFVGRTNGTALRADRQPPVPGWVQAASGMVGSVWAGPFLDADSNGAMEFAPPAAQIPPNCWTKELNFLRLRPWDGSSLEPLPAGYKLRVSVQWREPHDLDDVFAPDPVYPVRLHILRQLDPKGEQVSSDELIEAARSTGPIVRLGRTATSGTYELAMTFTVPEDGSYALQVERTSAGDSFLAARRERSDYRSRIVLLPADVESAEKGRPVFGPFAPQNSGVGIPGDARAAVTVGAAGGAGFTEPLTLTAAGPGIDLAIKPDLLTAGVIATGDQAAAGSGASAAFVGGAAACLRSAGARIADLVRNLGLAEGGPFALPPAWLAHLSPSGERPTR